MQKRNNAPRGQGRESTHPIFTGKTLSLSQTRGFGSPHTTEGNPGIYAEEIHSQNELIWNRWLIIAVAFGLRWEPPAYEHRHKQTSTDREERRERKLKETDKESKPGADSQRGLKDHDNNVLIATFICNDC